MHVPTKLAGLLVGSAALLSIPAVAGAVTAEANVNGGCRIGAQAFEHWTAARHISYDDNGGCAKIHQTAVRRCWGTNYTSSYGYTTANTIDRQWNGCDHVYTRTNARNSSDVHLGSVQAG